MKADIDQDLLILMMVVARLTRVEADRRARQHGMTRAQWSILKQVFYFPGLIQKELADLLEVEPITAARLVDRLEKAGLIERRADARDKRIWRLHVTPAAEPYLEEIDRQRQEIGDFITAGLSESDRQKLIDSLKLMKTNLLRGAGQVKLPGCYKKTEGNA